MSESRMSRFTKKSRTGRSRISRRVRDAVMQRDNSICQFCGKKVPANELTIDHLVPISFGGIDDIINYISSCKSCNELKSCHPLDEFAQMIQIDVKDLPVHGDPVIDNESLPIQIRLVRKRIYDKLRIEGRISGKSAHKKIEKEYRRSFWATDKGKSLEKEFPLLPSHARIMIPEIRTIAKSTREFLLLVELSKSANTRNLIGSVLTSDCDVEKRLLTITEKTKNEALKKRIDFALRRFRKELASRGL